MIDYERGHIAGQIAMREMVSKELGRRAAYHEEWDDQELAAEVQFCRGEILSLQPEAGADQREAAAVPCVSVPRELLMRCARQISELASIRHHTAYRTTEQSGPLLDAISYALAAAKEE